MHISIIISSSSSALLSLTWNLRSHLIPQLIQWGSSWIWLDDRRLRVPLLPLAHVDPLTLVAPSTATTVRISMRYLVLIRMTPEVESAGGGSTSVNWSRLSRSCSQTATPVVS